jgi:hypothetical protein
MAASLEDRIRERAYFLSQGGGGVDDGAHFWLIAERDVLAEVAMESAATQLWEAMPLGGTASPTPMLKAAEEQPKKIARKPRATAKRSAKASAKAIYPAAASESPAVEPALVTPFKSPSKRRARTAAW